MSDAALCCKSLGKMPPFAANELSLFKFFYNIDGNVGICVYFVYYGKTRLCNGKMTEDDLTLRKPDLQDVPHIFSVILHPALP